MAIRLDQALAWTTANAEERAMLADLQGNILKSHGRHTTLDVFLRLGGDQAKSRLLMRRLGMLTISALDQLFAAEAYKMAKRLHQPTGATPTFFSVLLSHGGYEKLGYVDRVPADDGAFKGDMKARHAELNDRHDHLDPEWVDEAPDVLIIVASDPDGDDAWTSARLDEAEALIMNIITPLEASVAFTQRGRAIERRQTAIADGKGRAVIEHFGYVDGRSQPLFLSESIAEEAAIDGDDKWSPRSPLKQVLVADPGSQGGFGSFFVYRKLEQNVAAFKEAEETLGGGENGNLDNGELAGATLVGRFEDGTPVIVSKSDGVGPASNNFNYDADADGWKCPVHAHVRKSNPRGDSVRAGLATLEEEHSHLMARRGMTYGKRDRVIDPTDKPTGDVGLLFMAYMSSISHQFEFTQQTWVNNPAFVRGGNLDKAPPDSPAGSDPVIGQPPSDLVHPRVWGEPGGGVLRRGFGGHVTLKGGGYFFAPARSTLLTM